MALALREGRVHDRNHAYINEAGRSRERRGVFAGQAPPGAEIVPERLDGAWVKRRRDDLGWSQADLAARVGVTEHSVSQWERGSVPLARSDAVREAIETAMPHPGGLRKGVAERLSAVVAAIAEQPGLTRSEISRGLFSDSRAARHAIRLAIESGAVHEWPVSRRRGTSTMTVRGLYPGPAPKADS